MASPAHMFESPVAIRAHTKIAHDVVLVEMVDPGGRELPPWAPGAHVDLVLDDGLVRQYSLCGDPADRHTYRVAVLRARASRGGSAHVHERLAVGDVISVRGPRNHFPLEPAARYTFIAGGIGITPLLPMLRSADAQGVEWRLTYGGRTAESMAFCEELAGNPRVEIVPEDQFGPIDLRGALGGMTPGTLVYCCGPEPLLTAVEAAVGEDNRSMLRTERFIAETRTGTAQEPFLVELAASGTSVKVSADQSVLTALIEAGHDVPYSCEDGVCGSCETVVLDGRPDHRDVVMTAEEHDAAGTMQICVSRALTDRLVLDL